MSFSTNILISKDDPGVLYNASEFPAAYHEDHEINGIMYRASNAQYNETPANNWSSIDNTRPSYATVQNPDGSTGYLSYPATSTTWNTDEWQGSTNNAVFNAVDYGMSTGDMVGTDNLNALREAINAAAVGGNATGGTVVIPSGTYNILGTVSLDYLVPGTDHGLIIAGTSGDTQLTQLQNSAPTFSFTGLSSRRGVRIRDLRITYVTGGITPPVLPAAVLANNCDAVVCERVYFKDCPTAFSIQSGVGASSRCGLLQCEINYNSYDNATMVYINGAESFIERSCRFPGERREAA
jgi:hypothetical protein